MTLNQIVMHQKYTRGIEVVEVDFVNRHRERVRQLHFEHEDMVRMPQIVEDWLLRNILPD